MSLFPAYNTNNNNNKNEDDENLLTTETESTTEDSNNNNNNNNNKWLENSSFIPIEKLLSTTKTTTATVEDNICNPKEDEEKIIDNCIIPEQNQNESETNRKRKHKESKKSNKKHKKDKKHKKQQSQQQQKQQSKTIIITKDEKDKIEFTGMEEYYVDKSSQRSYLNVNTLCRPSCPKYRIYSKIITGLPNYSKSTMINKFKRRYFQIKSSSKNSSSSNLEQLSDLEFMAKTKSYQKQLGENPSDVTAWIELIHLQDKTPMKIQNKSQLTERKLSILDRALKENPSNEQIYHLYIDIIDKTYPSFEVSKILDNLIKIDPTNYTLWNAQILATQSSMARCNVTDVLQLYELCMKNMYKRNRYDEIMLKLFTNCLFFLRQCGLYEQFFSLIKLSFELNIASGKFSSIQNNGNTIMNRDAEQILIEYEEVILKSGLPMAELWFRIEKLRQNFMFLPIENQTNEQMNISDPQRIVFNSDIVQYVYPITDTEYTFQLILIIIRLLKIPIYFGGSMNSNRKWFLHKNEENVSQFDSIEELFSIFLYRHFIYNNDNDNDSSINQFDCIFFDLIKDFCNGPSYLSTIIGYEQYLKITMEILLITIDCYTIYDDDGMKDPSSTSLFEKNLLKKQQRNILILIWLRFERILYYLDVIMGKVTVEKQRKLCGKIKNFLKRPENRNNILLYIEYALIEYEMGRCTAMESVLIKAIDQCSNDHHHQLDDDGDDDYDSINHDENFTRSTLTYAYITFIELMLKEKQYNKALNILICLALKEEKITLLSNDHCPTETKKLLALKVLTKQLDNLIAIEKTIEIMELEQYFLPDLFINLIRARYYLLFLINHRSSRFECTEQLNTLIQKTFKQENNDRHKFIRENLYELQIKLLQEEFFTLSVSLSTELKINYIQLYECILNGLKEFPKNLLLLKVATTHFNSFTWQKVSRLLLKSSSSSSSNTSTTSSIESIIFLIVAAKLRYKKRYFTDELSNLTSMPTQLSSSQVDTNECTYKLRVINLLRNVLQNGEGNQNKFRKNSLLWRLYLRSLLDVNENFEKSKNILFAALDECPWNKALYLDGGIFVPQELSHLQDLMIEKQLRVYALPDELEILRSDDVD